MHASYSFSWQTLTRVSLTIQEPSPPIASQKRLAMPTLEVRQGSLQEVLSDAEVLFDWKLI